MCECDTGYTAGGGNTCASGISAVHSAVAGASSSDSQSSAAQADASDAVTTQPLQKKRGMGGDHAWASQRIRRGWKVGSGESPTGSIHRTVSGRDRPGSLRELVFLAAARQGRLPAWMMDEKYIGVRVRRRRRVWQ